MSYAYLRDAFLTCLETEVVETGDVGGRPFAVTADTIFYPEGGGQPADHGELGAARVVDVQHAGGRIRHLLSAPVPAGPVVLRLDWARRFDHMQQHTAQHLLTAVADRDFGWATTAFHLGPELSDIELAAPGLNDVQLGRLEDAVADEVRAARAVSSRVVDPGELSATAVRSRGLPDGHSGPVRLVEIAGIDCNTCGGTHLRNTADIGVFGIVGSEQLRGGTRVFFVAGDRVRWRLAAHEARTARLRSLLGAPDDELVAAAELRLGKEKELLRENRRLSGELANAVARALAARTGAVISEHWHQADMALLQSVARQLQKLAPAAVALLTGGETDGVFVLACGAESAADASRLGSRVAELLDGRGGGSAGLFQGKAAALDRRDEAVELLRKLLAVS